MNTETKYLGLELKSPIIVGSCGLTSDVDKMMQMEQAGRRIGRKFLKR